MTSNDKTYLDRSQDDEDEEDSTDPRNATPEIDGGASDFCCKRIINFFYPGNFKTEIRDQVKLAIPVFITSIAMFAMMMISNTFCGRISTLNLASSGLATTMINSFGLSIAQGLCTACDTMFSQVFGGSNRKMMGTILQRSLLINMIAPFIIWIYLMNMHPIFLLIGQDPEVAEKAANYMTWFSPGLFFYFIFLTCARYLQNQDKVLPPMLVAIGGNIVNVALQFLFVWGINYGIYGSSIALALSYFSMTVFIIVYIIVSKCYVETWNGFEKVSLLQWGDYIKLAIPGMAMITLEILVWEAGTLLAGYLGQLELGIQTVLYSIECCTFMLSFGVSIATNIRVGQAMGRNDPDGAYHALTVSVTLFLMTAGITSCLLYALRFYVVGIFSEDHAVINGSIKLLPILIAFLFLDGFNIIFAGCLRGCAMQTKGAIIVLVAYYAFCLPLSFILVFLWKLEVLGIWLALLISAIILCLGFLFIILRINWEKVAEQTQSKFGCQGLSTVFEDSTLSCEQTPLLNDNNIQMGRSTASVSMSGTVRHRNFAPSLRTYSTSQNVLRRVSFMPYTSSIAVPEIAPPRRVTRSQFRRIVRTKLVAIFIIFMCFIGGVILRLFMPKIVEKYFPYIYPKNVTMVPSATPSSVQDDLFSLDFNL